VLARTLEAHGIATSSISLVREHTEKVKPPRALFVPFPFGHALGRPNDPALQHRVLRAALDLFCEGAGPVLRDLPDDAEPGDQPPLAAQASGITAAVGVPEDVAAEMTQMRPHHEQWLAQKTVVARRSVFPASPPASSPASSSSCSASTRARTRTWPGDRETCRCRASSAGARTI